MNSKLIISSNELIIAGAEAIEGKEVELLDKHAKH